MILPSYDGSTDAKTAIDRVGQLIGDTILSAAAETDADVVVMGRRGRSGVRSFLLGSVSRAVGEHADLPVLVAPSVALAARGAPCATMTA